MIIRRYIATQVLVSTLTVAGVLTVILMSGRVIRYLGMAAAGKIDVSLLSAVLFYRLPQFLELIVPLGMFIGILLVFGRLYIDNEMAVLSASGVSRLQIVRHLAWPVAIIMLAVGTISLYLTPTGNAISDEIFAQQAKRNTFDLVKPGQFQHAGERMLYVSALSPDRTELRGVYLFEQLPARSGDQLRQVVVYAERGRRETDAHTHAQFLQLESGYRYETEPGTPAYSEVKFDRLRARLPDADQSGLATANPSSTSSLLKRIAHDHDAMAEWLWRISMPALVPVVALLAFSLSRVNPRQGRYLKLLPAILFYLSYIVFIVAARNGVQKGHLHPAAVWGVHLLYLLLGVLILGWEWLMNAWRWQRSRGAPA